MVVFNTLGSIPMNVTLDGLTITNGAGVGAGGGIWAGDFTAVTIRNGVITNNTAQSGGGGIYLTANASVTVINTTISGNHSNLDGGGIWNAGTLTLLSSTVEANTAVHDGGGLFVAGGVAQVRNSTISGNSAASAGGISNGDASGFGVIHGGMLTLTSSTIVANSHGIVHGGNGGDRTYVANSIVAGNSITGCSAPSGGFSSLGYNIGVGCASHFTTTGDQNILATQVFTQLVEQQLKDNGGPTKTHALIARGLAVDAGYCPGETADQRGFTRPVDDPTMPNAVDACDIGAYEAQGPQVAVADLMVSQTVDKNSVKQGELLTYTVRVQNLGPQTAPDVVLNNVLSSGVTFVEARQNKGSVTAPPQGETGTVTWYLGDMADQANEFAEIVVTVLVKGKTTVTNTATVSGDVADPNEANNTAAITVSVVAGKSGGKKG